jgi:hypothetical protein
MFIPCCCPLIICSMIYLILLSPWCYFLLLIHPHPLMSSSLSTIYNSYNLLPFVLILNSFPPVNFPKYHIFPCISLALFEAVCFSISNDYCQNHFFRKELIGKALTLIPFHYSDIFHISFPTFQF